MKLHIFRLSGHDFVHYRKIEIGANDRAVYQQSISCFIVYANFDWFLINFYYSSFILTLAGSEKKSIMLFCTKDVIMRNTRRYEKTQESELTL